VRRTHRIFTTTTMKLSDIISDDIITVSLHGTDVPSILREFSEAVCSSGKFYDSTLLYERLLDRENQGSTGIGNGVAIPHCKIENLQNVVLAVGYSQSGVDFKAIDGKPTSFFFLVVSPSNAAVLHLRTLAALSRLLKYPTFISSLKLHPNKEELIALIKQEEQNAAVTP